jgi:hypothetical protein
MSQSSTHRGAKAIFGVAALMSAALGVLFLLFAPQIGVDEATGRWIAAAFLFVAVTDIALLMFWDRIAGPPR